MSSSPLRQTRQDLRWYGARASRGGTWLVSSGSDRRFYVLAPPAVALGLAEAPERLERWRCACWASEGGIDDAPLSPPQTLSTFEVMERLPEDCHPWIEHVMRSQLTQCQAFVSCSEGLPHEERARKGSKRLRALQLELSEAFPDQLWWRLTPQSALPPVPHTADQLLEEVDRGSTTRRRKRPDRVRSHQRGRATTRIRTIGANIEAHRSLPVALTLLLVVGLCSLGIGFAALSSQSSSADRSATASVLPAKGSATVTVREWNRGAGHRARLRAHASAGRHPVIPSSSALSRNETDDAERSTHHAEARQSRPTSTSTTSEVQQAGGVASGETTPDESAASRESVSDSRESSSTSGSSEETSVSTEAGSTAATGGTSSNSTP
jgi:hypothetical protein